MGQSRGPVACRIVMQGALIGAPPRVSALDAARPHGLGSAVVRSRVHPIVHSGGRSGDAGNTYLNTTLAELRLVMMWTTNIVINHGRAIVGMRRRGRVRPEIVGATALAVISRA